MPPPPAPTPKMTNNPNPPDTMRSLRRLTSIALAACLLAAACSTPQTPATPQETTAAATTTPPSPPQQPMQDNQQPPRDNALRAGRVSQLSEGLWVITPEDNPNARICLQGELAVAFQTEGLRLQFRATVHPPKPNERRACSAADFKFIGDLAEGATPDDSDIDYDEREDAP